MLFFQVMLLAGYAYVLATIDWLGVRRQAVIHLALLLLAALYFPLLISEKVVQSLPTQGNPIFWLLGTLLSIIGLPFFLVSASGPLLQKWFSHTYHYSAHDPYYLYAASNAGSLIALLGYPLLLEPFLNLRQQSWLWAGSYGVLVILMLLCAIVTWQSTTPKAEALDQANNEQPKLWPVAEEQTEAMTLSRRLHWALLAFIPSSLMLGVTTYISTDIATVPLLWIIPLAIYLLTLILVFARRQLLSQRWIALLLPRAALILALVYLSGATQPSWFIVFLHLLFFFLAAMVCHGRLARMRPSTRHLAEFYLWMAVGGALGGFFNALVAPSLFNTVVEYPLAIVLACLMHTPQSTKEDGPRERWLDLGLPLGVLLLTTALALSVTRFKVSQLEEIAIVLGIPLMLSYFWRMRPVRFALAVGAIMLGSSFYSATHDRDLHVERNFFGVLRVTRDAGGASHQLYNGNTLHGRQFRDPARQCEPLSYYHRTGPLGQVFAAFNANPASTHVAVIGLGAGATVCYAAPHQQWTFYEINPAVLSIAQDARYFTYLKSCAATSAVATIIGDARLRLREAPAGQYGLIVLDAFSSDAIPIHLMTREAIALYLSKLAEGGMLAFHISNRNLDLHPVLADLAEDANLTSLGSDDLVNDPAAGKEGSQWVVMARRATDLGDLAKDARWMPLQRRSRPQVWSDDFSNIVSVFRWQ